MCRASRAGTLRSSHKHGPSDGNDARRESRLTLAACRSSVWQCPIGYDRSASLVVLRWTVEELFEEEPGSGTDGERVAGRVCVEFLSFFGIYSFFGVGSALSVAVSLVCRLVGLYLSRRGRVGSRRIGSLQSGEGRKGCGSTRIGGRRVEWRVSRPTTDHCLSTREGARESDAGQARRSVKLTGRA